MHAMSAVRVPPETYTISNGFLQRSCNVTCTWFPAGANILFGRTFLNAVTISADRWYRCSNRILGEKAFETLYSCV
jgi:hypothetical protein